MNRRAFLRTSTTTAGAALFGPAAVWAINPSKADTVLRGGLIFDGTGARPFEADIAIAGSRIAGVGRRLQASGAREMDLRGLAVAPGFIDIHSHSDLVLLINPRAESKVRQGVTTEVVGQDGGSIGPWTADEHAEIREEYRSKYGVDIPFRDLADFFRHIDMQGAGVNLASMVGQGTVRGFVVGDDNRPATPAEITRMTVLVREMVRTGACGLSSGLEYTPSAFASTPELAAVATALQGTGLPYASHMRNEDDQLLPAVEEAIAVGRQAGIPVEISHLKAQGQRNWPKAGPVLEMIEKARKSGTDVRFDVYPYVAYSTGLANLFPVTARDGGTDAFIRRLRDPSQRAGLESGVREKIAKLGTWDAVQITSTHSDALAWARGRRLGGLATERGEDPYALLVRLIVEDQNRAGMVGFGMSEENVARMLAHPLSIICSDGGARAPYGPLSEGTPHPRTYGTFPRVLGRYVREQRVMPLETAIHKMTGMPAARLRFLSRGRIAPGMIADLVAFDPDRVIDQATFEKPHQYPLGIPHVWVNGVAVIRDGEHTGALPGRVVRPGKPAASS